MPRETISIPLKSLPVYEASAVFFSAIAYPDPLDKVQRENFRIAMSRWAILERAKIDKEWRKAAQEIRPEIISQEERLYLQSSEKGTDLLTKRIFCAAIMVGPHLPKEPIWLFGIEPTVDNLATTIAECMGMSRESYKTIESRLWAPTKPVAHAALMLAWFIAKVRQHRENGHWEDEHWLCDHNLLLGALFYSDILAMLVEIAERLRLRLPKIKAFRIKEQNTVQFVLD
jgi:hypothetical protein